jgi:anti-sigma factor RsiW
MSDLSHPPLTDDELHALVDGRVPASELPALQVRLGQDPAAQARVSQWQQQRDLLRGLHKPLDSIPPPPELVAAAQALETRQARYRAWERLGGIAAGLVLTFGLGWMGRGLVPQAENLSSNSPRVVREFVQQASVAHAVFTPEVRHPVEVTAADQAHLVQWLSKRLGKPLQLPQLQALGYDLVGGRLLPGSSNDRVSGSGSTRAQFMYQNAAGARITLYLGALAPTSPTGTGSSTLRLQDETAFSLADNAGLPSFYWVDHGFGYALSGKVPTSELMAIARAVYQQL